MHSYFTFTSNEFRHIAEAAGCGYWAHSFANDAHNKRTQTKADNNAYRGAKVLFYCSQEGYKGIVALASLAARPQPGIYVGPLFNPSRDWHLRTDLEFIVNPNPARIVTKDVLQEITRDNNPNIINTLLQPAGTYTYNPLCHMTGDKFLAIEHYLKYGEII